jgi:hypothetical protein
VIPLSRTQLLLSCSGSTEPASTPNDEKQRILSEQRAREKFREFRNPKRTDRYERGMIASDYARARFGYVDQNALNKAMAELRSPEFKKVGGTLLAQNDQQSEKHDLEQLLSAAVPFAEQMKLARREDRGWSRLGTRSSSCENLCRDTRDDSWKTLSLGDRHSAEGQ